MPNKTLFQRAILSKIQKWVSAESNDINCYIQGYSGVVRYELMVDVKFRENLVLSNWSAYLFFPNYRMLHRNEIWWTFFRRIWQKVAIKIQDLIEKLRFLNKHVWKTASTWNSKKCHNSAMQIKCNLNLIIIHSEFIMKINTSWYLNVNFHKDGRWNVSKMNITWPEWFIYWIKWIISLLQIPCLEWTHTCL